MQSLIKDILNSNRPLFAVIDSAGDPEIFKKIRLIEDRSESLFNGNRAVRLAEYAPYLIEISQDSLFLDMFINKGWGKSRGIFLASDVPFDQIRKHLAGLLWVIAADQSRLFFRYYDPRVLREFLPTFNADNIRKIFGPIKKFIVESENPEKLLIFSLDLESDKLIINVLP